MTRILSGPLQRALVVENPSPLLDELLRAGGLEVERIAASPEEDDLIELLRKGRHQLLYKRSRVPVTRRVVESCPELVAVQLCCIGDDSVDKEACAERGVLVFNDPVSNGRSVVELVMGHLVGLSRRLYETYDEARDGIWTKSNLERYEVQGKVLGVIGLGNIGRSVARQAARFGLDIRFFDSREVAREVGEEMGWTAVASLERLFATSDIVTVHLSATDVHGSSNRGVLTREHLMSLGAERPETSPRHFINLSRGFIHEPADLLAAIAEGRIRRAAVDVYPDEPRRNGPGWDNPYASEPRIACTPHIGAATQEAQPRIARRVAQTSLAYSAYGSLRDCVMAPRTRISMQDDLRPGRAVLQVIHATTRGTKKALDDAIFEAGVGNLRSAHRDLPAYGIAYDVSLLDRPMADEELARIADLTSSITGDPQAVRLVRQLV